MKYFQHALAGPASSRLTRGSSLYLLPIAHTSRTTQTNAVHRKWTPSANWASKLGRWMTGRNGVTERKKKSKSFGVRSSGGNLIFLGEVEDCQTSNSH